MLNGGPINVIDAFDLLPQQTRHSLVLSGRQALGDRLEIASTALYSDRKVESSSVGIANTTSVAKSWIESESLSATFSADYMLRPDWSLTLDGTYSRIRNDNVQQIILPAVATPSEAKTKSSLWSVGLLTRGDLFALPGGTIHAALGGQFRREDFALRQVGMSPLRDGTRDISAVFAELLIPLVGTENRIPGIDRLELNLSGRIDDYSDFGSTANPKAGLLWVPVDRLMLRGSYSTSFAPPTLGQSGANDRAVGVLSYDFIRNILAIPLPDPSLAGVNYMITIGTAPDLEPETSTTYTAGFDYELMRGRQSLTLSGSYYDIRFEDRLGVTPVPGNLNANYAPGFAFADPGLFPEGTVIFFPSEAKIAAVIDSLSRPVIFAGGATALENIGFINNVSLTRNLASTETSGLDLQVSYETDTDAAAPAFSPAQLALGAGVAAQTRGGLSGKLEVHVGHHRGCVALPQLCRQLCDRQDRCGEPDRFLDDCRPVIVMGLRTVNAGLAQRQRAQPVGHEPVRQDAAPDAAPDRLYHYRVRPRQCLAARAVCRARTAQDLLDARPGPVAISPAAAPQNSAATRRPAPALECSHRRDRREPDRRGRGFARRSRACPAPQSQAGGCPRYGRYRRSAIFAGRALAGLQSGAALRPAFGLFLLDAGLWPQRTPALGQGDGQWRRALPAARSRSGRHQFPDGLLARQHACC
ncbi:MAG: hypothetical protein B7Z22_10470, partial [Hyphomonas sp. 32-62-5]